MKQWFKKTKIINIPITSSFHQHSIDKTKITNCCIVVYTTIGPKISTIKTIYSSLLLYHLEPSINMKCKATTIPE